MGNPLRDRRTPREFAASGQIIDFKEKISDFERLAEISENDLSALDAGRIPPGWRDRVIAGRLRFGFADAQQGLPTLEGTVTATLDTVCQRCLQAMELPLAVDLRLLFTDDDTLADNADFEVWELNEDTLRPLDIVEESLIMALPLAAVHGEDGDCRRPEEAAAKRPDTVRPFASLKAQMENDN